MTSKGMAHFQAELSDSEVTTLIEMALLALFESEQIPFAIADEETYANYHTKPEGTQ